jgi:cytoplasmic iron level regulating protein YaaA (DUF328/UPF0246 family)
MTTRSDQQKQQQPGVSIAAAAAAKSHKVLDEYAAQLKMPPFASSATVPTKRSAILEFGAANGLFVEMALAEVAAEKGLLPEAEAKISDRLAALEQQIAAVTKAATAAADAVEVVKKESAVGMARLEAKMDSLQQKVAEQLAEQQDVPAQQALANQGVCWTGVQDSAAVKEGGEALLATLRSAFAAHDIDASCITSARPMLSAKHSDKPTPIIFECQDADAKQALLRAVREKGVKHLQVSARLTRWQQQRRAAFKSVVTELKEKREAFRFYKGHVLQRLQAGKWADVPVPTAH